jgi:NADH:ubiquinone oxidoreductase subunit F (NADH-binding)
VVSVELLKGRRGWPSILLTRAGKYDPSDEGAGIVLAESTGAWVAWRRAVTTMTPESVIRVVAESGLHGRGGGAFPTGEKWRACRAAEGRIRHVVANGFEADPGAQVDRTLMELDPHLIVEGTALAAFAVGATEATIVVGAGGGTAAARLRATVAAAEAAGYLGENVLATGPPLWIDVRELTGSFVVGEETVLLRALEEKRAQPDQRPPFPSEKGLHGRPTVVNNVKTLAAVPWIVTNGPSAYAAIGDPQEPGTTLVQLSGAVTRSGILEVPTGTPLQTILDAASGSAPVTNAPILKALLVGGPAGGFLPPSALQTPLSRAALVAAGAIAGSGSIVGVDGSSCIVELATLMTRFLSDEACGKTIPCRIGTRRLAELGDGFCTGRCRPTDVDLVRSLAADVRDAALCGLEANAANPLLSGMRYFAQEFEDHIVRGSCPAGVCRPVRAVAAAAPR